MLVNVRMGSTAKGSWGEQGGWAEVPWPRNTVKREGDRGSYHPLSGCVSLGKSPNHSEPQFLLCAFQACGAPEQEKVFGGCGPRLPEFEPQLCHWSLNCVHQLSKMQNGGNGGLYPWAGCGIM